MDCFEESSKKEMKLTEKQLAFCEEYVKNGYNGGGAYKIAYNQDNSQVCASESYKLLRDPKIIEHINGIEGSFRIIGHMQGVDKKSIMFAIKEMLCANKQIYNKNGEVIAEIPDYTARKNAIDAYAKLTGDYTDKKQLEITTKDDLDDTDLTKLSKEELDQLEQDILKGL